MLKTQFKDKLEFDLYKIEQKVRMEKGYLARSERETLKKMLDKNYKPTFIKEEKPKLPIVTNIKELRKPCLIIEKNENVSAIIKNLKETLNCINGLGLSAPQIGYNKQISYIKIPKVTKDKKIEFTELILINPKIIEHDRRIIVKGEGCLSLPNLRIDTDRWVFITLINYNEKLEPQTFMSQDLESLIIQHEYDHLFGKLILDRKHKSK